MYRQKAQKWEKVEENQIHDREERVHKLSGQSMEQAKQI